MYKILVYIKLIVIFTVSLNAQELSISKYGVAVVDNIDLYEQLIAEDSSKILVDLEEFIPGLKTDIRYATSNNFLGEPVYNMAKAYARLPVAESLKAVSEELKIKGLELKVFDAYRPYSSTVIFYEKIMDTVFVASAWKGSRHNRGCAVDLTIVNSATGEELKMPTPYDDFTEKAHVDYNDLDSEILENRKVLMDIMTKHGFNIYPAEWWHYDYNGWEKFELVDLSFEKLAETK